MACQITRNTKGKITRVAAENGNDSLLFNKIESLSFVGNKEDALTYYMYAVTNLKDKHGDKLVLDENGEPILIYKPLSNKDNLLNASGEVLETEFFDAYKKDFQRKGVELGFMISTGAAKSIQFNGTIPQQQAKFSEALEKTKVPLRITYTNGTVQYGIPSEKNFISFDTIQRDLNPKTYEGLIQTYLDMGIDLVEQTQDPYADFRVEQLSETEFSVMAVLGNKTIGTLRLKQEADGFRVDTINVKPGYQ
ncbi:MAG: hypothetical protein WD512_17885, partial [Candidatus Paceibacterota bacterium]